MADPNAYLNHELIDLSSDRDSGSNASDSGIEFFDAEADFDFEEDVPSPVHEHAERPNQSIIQDREVIDLTAIPDVDVPPSDPIVVEDYVRQARPDPSHVAPDADLVTAEVCLQMMLRVLPDISVDHARSLIAEKTSDATRTIPRSEQLIWDLLDNGAYPKESDVSQQKKRKREDEDDLAIYEKGERDQDVGNYEREA